MTAEILIGTLVVVAVVVALAAGLVAARALLIPDGAATVRINGLRELAARRGDALLSVLQRGGLAIPAACGGNGTCGLCRVTVEGPGAGEVKATERGLLSPAERRHHVRLACQVSLRGPVEVAVPDAMLAAETRGLRVISNEMLAPLIRELVLEAPPGGAEFRPGDFMELRAPAYALDLAGIAVPERFREVWEVSRWTELRAGTPEPVSRAYSLANRPDDAGRLVFDIRLAVPPAGRERELPAGIVSSWLYARQPGDVVEASGPFGEFHIQPGEAEMVFVGGGVGMAPLRSMIHHALASGGDRRVRYFYGARSAADLLYSAEFDRLDANHARFDWVPTLSDPAPGDRWTGATGFVHETLRAVMSAHPAPERCQYYLCGPPVMISAVLATLHGLGVDPANIFNDDFGS